MKLAHGQKKYLLKKAAQPFLSPSVLNHRKQGFASPMAMWLRGSLREFVKTALRPAAIERSGVLLSGQVQRSLMAHDERRSLNDKQIFSLLMFQRWWQRDQG
jgi:asparagine synthase (glutamine-hydrolysing)